jgi:hypothetical protein
MSAEDVREGVDWADTFEARTDERVWPVLGEDAYHGLAGEIIRAIEPHSEADPAAMLFQLLAAFGNCVGSVPYLTIEGTNHTARLFVLVVGNTSQARKGTSWGRVYKVFAMMNTDWCDRQCSGLSSGEGLIHALRDAEQAPPAKGG